METEKTFIQLCKEGKTSPDKIDDFIDEWHHGGCQDTLYDYLGMTWEEYGEWVRDPRCLKKIVNQV